jgi:uncharacterized repeat protein (TIGR03803 family)
MRWTSIASRQVIAAAAVLVSSSVASAQHLVVLHSFTGWRTEGAPNGLVQATDGNFYGTTPYGGASDSGTIFKMTSGGTVTILHAFGNSLNDAAYPHAGVIRGTDGHSYGTAAAGGASGSGVVFRLRLPQPFTDDPLIARSNVAGAVHITELRAATIAVE